MSRFWKPVRKRVQSELIKRGHCVGCTRSLMEAKRTPYSDDSNKEVVTCQCRRVYIYDKLINHYRRAQMNEVRAKGNSNVGGGVA
ncbi:hypothetical protein KKB83_01005 [Patescibacteria group bacterium]|nr:hypothetical protein [Patescibacteria group bacterium]